MLVRILNFVTFVLISLFHIYFIIAVVACPRWLGKDGYELQLTVNHLAPFLLTNLLLEKLKSSASSRIVNVNSRAYTSSLFIIFKIKLTI